jgi:hypothetical protein
MARKRLTKAAVQEVLKLVDSIPAPTQVDIDRAKVAAFTCRSPDEFEEFLELNSIVFRHWCDTNNRYKDAVYSWRNHATKEIEVAMAKRAIGFKKTTRRDVLTKLGTVETLEVETYYPPDPTAAQFWLKNRAPNDWQDKKEIDVNVNANIRAWLVQAGGQLDPSETIDISPGSLIANEAATLTMNEVGSLTNDEINNIIANELEDNTQELLEAELITDLIAETEAPLPTVELENNSPVSPDDGARPAWQALNSKWI